LSRNFLSLSGHEFVEIGWSAVACHPLAACGGPKKLAAMSVAVL
jgi:hypothetical protein